MREKNIFICCSSADRKGLGAVPVNLTIISGFSLFLFDRKILKVSLAKKKKDRKTESLKLQPVQIPGQNPSCLVLVISEQFAESVL